MTAHRGGVVLFLLLLPIRLVAATDGREAFAAPSATDDPPAFERWITGPVGYLLSEKEKQIADGLSNPADLTAFRLWFWQRRDPIPETVENEFRVEFEQRVDFANKEFGNSVTGAPGWMTPKGVVYIMLGRPTRIELTTSHLYRQVEAAVVESWFYEFDDAPVVEVPFVAVEGGFSLLITFLNRALHTRLDQALRRAAEGAIRHREIAYSPTSPPASISLALEWPATAAVMRTDDGVDAEISIPLIELYGKPEGEHLRIDLRFEAVPPFGGRRSILGDVNVLLRREVFEHWPGAKLIIALWLPTRAPLDDSSWIDITEVASGRGLRLAMGTRGATVQPDYTVDELLGQAPLLDGQGAAFFFIRANDQDERPSTSLRVLRHPGGYHGVVIEQPVPHLWLVQDPPSR